EVSFVEGELPQAPEGYVFESSQLSADSITILADGNEDIAWSVTNTYVSDEPGLAEGTFNLRKVLSGVEAGEFPEGTTFPVTATWADGSAEFDLPADGSVVSAGVSLPEGTEVSFVEGELPQAPEGYVFESSQLSADSITILADGNEDIAWSVTNTYVSDEPSVAVGGFDLVKVLDGVDAGDFPGDTVFTVVASWEVDGEAIEEEFALPVDGSVVAGPQDLPVGTVVSFDEIDVPDLDGFTFTGAEFSSESLEISAGESQEVTVTNTYVGDEPSVEVGGFDLVKVLDGVDAGDFPGDTVFTVVASWEVDGEAIEEEFALPVDGSVVAGPQDLPVGTVVSFDEIDVPDLDGFTFTGAEFARPFDGLLFVGTQDLPVGTVVSFDEIVVPDLDGFTFTGAEFSSESLFISAGESQEITAMNTYATDYRSVEVGGFDLVKVL